MLLRFSYMYKLITREIYLYFLLKDHLSSDQGFNDWEELASWTEENGLSLDFPVDWINKHFQSTLDAPLNPKNVALK